MDYGQSVIRLPTLSQFNENLQPSLNEHIKKKNMQLLTAIADGENLSIRYLLEKYGGFIDTEQNINVTQRKQRKIVPGKERCMAKKHDGERCTRRRKQIDGESNLYCGGHINSRPYGQFEQSQIDDEELCSVDSNNTTTSADKNSNRTSPVHIHIKKKSIQIRKKQGIS